MARPLNKLKDGVPYTRRQEIEACINEALTQDTATLLHRANIRSPRDPDYMPMECLLHLMREARLRRDRTTEGKLYLIFMARCEARLKKAIPDGSRADAGGIREEIMQKFGEIFARVGTNHDSTALDYYEVNFNHAFQVLRFKRLRQEARRDEIFVDLGNEKDEDGSPVDPEANLARLSAAAHAPARQENFVFLKQVLKALEDLSPENRETVRLVLIERYKVASDDPTEVTAATILGISRRAINKRLGKVAARLKKFRQENEK